MMNERYPNNHYRTSPLIKSNSFQYRQKPHSPSPPPPHLSRASSMMTPIFEQQGYYFDKTRVKMSVTPMPMTKKQRRVSSTLIVEDDMPLALLAYKKGYTAIYPNLTDDQYRHSYTSESSSGSSSYHQQQQKTKKPELLQQKAQVEHNNNHNRNNSSKTKTKRRKDSVRSSNSSSQQEQPARKISLSQHGHKDRSRSQQKQPTLIMIQETAKEPVLSKKDDVKQKNWLSNLRKKLIKN